VFLTEVKQIKHFISEEKQKYFELLKEHYNWDKIAEDVFEVYKSLVAKKI